MNRRFLLLTLLLAASAILTAGLVPRTDLPHPKDASREQLVHWLVLRDLRGEPEELRLVLVRRLEEEFGEGVDWKGLSGQLSQSQQQRIRENLIVLLRPWFMDKVDGYFSRSGEDRMAYMDRLLDTIVAWRGVDDLPAGGQEGDGGEIAFSSSFSRRLSAGRKRPSLPARNKSASFF